MSLLVSLLMPFSAFAVQTFTVTYDSATGAAEGHLYTSEYFTDEGANYSIKLSYGNSADALTEVTLGTPTITDEGGKHRAAFSGTASPGLNPDMFVLEESVWGSTSTVRAKRTGTEGTVSTYSGLPTPDILSLAELDYGFPGTEHIEIMWSKVDGATEYRVYRAENENGPFAMINAKTVNGFIHPTGDADSAYDIGQGKTYWYKVETVSPYGMSESTPKSIQTAGDGGGGLGPIAATATDAEVAMKENNMAAADGDAFEITLGNATVKDTVGSSDLAIVGLPDFIGLTVTKSDANKIRLAPMGAAAMPLTAPANVTIVVKASAVNEAGAQDSAQLTLAFVPYAPPPPPPTTPPSPPSTVCGDPAVPPCATVSVFSGPGSADGVLPNVEVQSGLLQVKLNNKTPAVTESVYEGQPVQSYDYTELPGDSAGTVYALDVKPGSFDPVILIGTGDVKEWSVQDGTAAIRVGPMPFSFDRDGAKDGDGHDRAEISYANAIQLAFDDGAMLTAEQRDLVRGMYIVTDAQSFGQPAYDAATRTVSIFIAGPHYRANGEENVGQFKAFLPSKLLGEWGVTAPEQLTAALSSGSLSNKQVEVTTGGMIVSFNVGYSEKTVSISANTDSEENPPQKTLTGLNVDAALMQLRVTHNPTKSFKVTAVYSDSSQSDVTTDDATTYSAEPAGIVSVDDGVVTALKAGEAVVTATHGGISRSFPVTVAPSAEHIYGDFKFPQGVNYDGFRIRVFAGASIPASLEGTVTDATYGGNASGIPISFHTRTVDGAKYMHVSLDVEPGAYSFFVTIPGYENRIENVAVSASGAGYSPFVPPAKTYKVGDAEMPYVDMTPLPSADSGGGNNNGGNGGGTGTDAPGGAAPNPSASQDAGDGGEEVVLGQDAAVKTRETTADGKAVTKVTVDAKALNEALARLVERPAEAKRIRLELGATEQVAAVAIPASALAGASADAEGAVLEVASETATYELPLGLLNLDALAAQLGTAAEGVTITITMEQVSGETAAELQGRAEGQGLALLGGAVEFRITAEGAGGSTEVNDFGSTYVSRSIIVPQQVDGNRATAVVFDPETGAMRFVPALFVTEDGATRVVIKRNGNSIYAVAESFKTFEDVADHWAKRDIELLASKLVLNGASATAFAPDRSVTRAEFAAMLVRALGLDERPTASKFSDVEGSAWYAGAVGAAAERGIVGGVGDGQFRPGDTITRQQMAVMIARALTFVGRGQADASASVSADRFADAAVVAEWAKAEVELAADAGIVSGRPDGTFAPNDESTRAEAAAMLYRLLRHLEFID
ncbi:S-layer homology domain-containing protein [Paenibacillus sp.]|uniref:S-layer homology domain-containing protein n=1 Tax=Paenibacillus sp. TaxID=58172 RepID=UPI002D5F333C|nr:S-layer homology domain-containing protein [Paenibacillus sp.]HZG88361.1 S-layer homology domain-containing protein [Paenibacillus sp.]